MSIPPSPLASVFSDNQGMSPITQPIFTDGFGHFSWYAAAGLYTVIVAIGGNIYQILPDQSLGAVGTGTPPGTALQLQTNGTVNPNQLLLNLVGTGDVSVVTNANGTTTINGTGVAEAATGTGTLLVSAFSNVSTAAQGTTLAADGSGNATVTGDSKVYASVFPGANLGAQIAAAAVSFGGNPGTVVVDVVGGSLTAPVTLPLYVDLVGASVYTTVNISGTGSIVLSGVNALRNITLSNTGSAASIAATSASEMTIDSVNFVGGLYGIHLNMCADFRISNVSFSTTAVTGGAFIFIQGGGPGTIVNPRIEAMIMETNSGPLASVGCRLIYLQNCAQVSVDNPFINGVDCSKIGASGAVSFSGASYCSLTGGIINNNTNCDGVLCESQSNLGGQGASYINISNVVSTNNSSNTSPAGAEAQTGDGFDVFNSSHIYFSNCVAEGNGTWNGNPQEGFEIFASYDVVCTGCSAIGNGNATLAEAGFGWSVVNSPFTKMIGCTSNYNALDGVRLVAGPGLANTVGTAVTLNVSSTETFGCNWEPGTIVYIAGTKYEIASIMSASALTLTTSAGTQTGATFIVASYGCAIQGSSFESNGQTGSVSGYTIGIQIGSVTNDFSGGNIVGNLSKDYQAAQTQTYGAQLSGNGRAYFIGNDFRLNKTGTINDTVGTSPQVYDDGSTLQVDTISLLAGNVLQAPTVSATDKSINAATTAWVANQIVGDAPATASIAQVVYSHTTTGQTAPVANATVYTTTAAGIFRVSGTCYATTLSSSAWSVVPQSTVTQNGATGSLTVSVGDAINIGTSYTGNSNSGGQIFNLASGAAIGVSVATNSGSNTAGVYAYSILIERLA